MSIVFDRLWVTMKEKQVTTYALIAKHGISPSLITRLKRNQGINTNSINNLCQILDCSVEDIMEFRKDSSGEI